MARVKGPCLSVDARGHLAKTIVFSFARGVNIVKWFKVSENPRSHAQILQRGLYSAGVEQWNALTVEQKESWNEFIRDNILTGFNAFMKDFLYYNSIADLFNFAYLISVFFDLHLFLTSIPYRPEYLMNRLFFDEGEIL